MTAQVTVRLVGWKRGFRKIEFTKLLRSSLSHRGLREAKAATDRLLAGEVVEVIVYAEKVDSFVDQAVALGAVVQ